MEFEANDGNQSAAIADAKELRRRCVRNVGDRQRVLGKKRSDFFDRGNRFDGHVGKASLKKGRRVRWRG
jgi:hypothetical protein